MAQSQAQLDNLKKGDATRFRSGDMAAREAGRKGGNAKAAKVRRNRSMNEMFKLMAKMPVKEGTVFDPETAASIQELSGQNMTAGETMGAQLFLKAMKGDTKAAGISPRTTATAKRTGKRRSGSHGRTTGRTWHRRSRISLVTFSDTTTRITQGKAVEARQSPLLFPLTESS